MSRRLPFAFDAVAAAVLVACALVTTIGADGLHHPIAEVVVVVWMGVVALRTAAPLATAVVSSGGAAAYAGAGADATPLWSFAALLLVGFAIGLELDGVRRLLASAVLLVGVYVLQVVTLGPSGSFGDEFVSPPILVLAPVLAGILVRRSRERAADLRRLTEELAQERERHLQLAVDDERRRIARELHDVISHSVSSMVVQAGAAASVLDPDDPAVAPLRSIRRTGREALSQLRIQLGLLRDGAQVDEPVLPDLDELRTYVHCAGAVYHEEGDVRDLPGGVAFAVVRVVHEGLANVARHASGAEAEVVVVRGEERVEVTVSDRGGRPSGERGTGYGLRGIQERVDLYGGTFSAGPYGTGWRLSAGFPLEPSAAPA